MSSSYLVKRQVTLTNSDNDGLTHFAGDVLSDWELPDFIKDKVKEGVIWYTETFEPLTDKEAEVYRKKATTAEGKRTAPDGQIVDPPWDDFIGLHPKEVIDRMKGLTAEDAEKVRQYERAGMNRSSIVEFVAPSEREPWNEYDNWSTREILDKMDVLAPSAVQDVIVYEMNHKKRAAIITYEPEEEESYEASPPEGEDGDDPGTELAGVGAASTDAGGQP